VLDKVRAARRLIDERKLAVEIEIDGGIKIDNARVAADAGVDILVSGTGLFGAPVPADAIRAMRAAAWG
jgi:ribulose-phosphate 3-epimerase